jgi:hypothetical protein
VLRVWFFQIVSTDELTEKIHEAISFSSRIVDLDIVPSMRRISGYMIFGKEVLVKADHRYCRTTYGWWETLTLIQDNEWNSSILTIQILSSTHTRLSWALLTKWQLTETKNVVTFILKDILIYHFIILNCCSYYSQKWKSIWTTVSMLLSSIRRFEC